MMALSMFGAMMTWMLIFVTHPFFRRAHRRSGEPMKYRLPFYPLGSVAGAQLMAALLMTTLFTKKFIMTLIFGVPFALGISVLYFVMHKRFNAVGAAEQAEQRAQVSPEQHQGAEKVSDSLGRCRAWRESSGTV